MTFEPLNDTNWIWEKINICEASQDYLSLIALYSILNQIRPEFSVERQISECMRLLGIHSSPTSQAGNLNITEFKRLSDATTEQELLFTHRIEATQIPSANSVTAPWMNVPPIDIQPVRLRTLINAEIVVGYDGVRVDDGLYIDDSQLTATGKHCKPELIADFSQPSSLSASFECAIHIPTSMITHWGHLWGEVLPSLALLHGVSHKFSGGTVFVVPEDTPSSALDAISSTLPPGIDLELRPRGTRVSVQTLFAPNPTHFRNSYISEFTIEDEQRVHTVPQGSSAIRQIHKAFLAASPDRYVVWDRSNSPMRKSSAWNSALRELAEKYDFELVDPSQLTFEEQCEVAGQSKVSIGMYGSWLNQVACLGQSGSTCVVITGDRSYECRHLFVTALHHGIDIRAFVVPRNLQLPYYSSSNYHSDLPLHEDTLLSLEEAFAELRANV